MDIQVQHRIKFTQTRFILSKVLILFGLFLPWFGLGDPASFDISPLRLKWSTIFTETGGRLTFPSLERGVPTGFLYLLGFIGLLLVRYSRLSPQMKKWTGLAVALFFIFKSVYDYVSLWIIQRSGMVIGLTYPEEGLYIFLTGSFILFLENLIELIKKKPDEILQ